MAVTLLAFCVAPASNAMADIGSQQRCLSEYIVTPCGSHVARKAGGARNNDMNACSRISA